MTQDKPACFGVFWEGVEGSDCTRPDAKTGKSCSAVDECLAAFATGTLARFQAELGDAATPERLAEVTSVDVKAIRLALEFQANIGAGPAVAVTPEGSDALGEPEASPPPAETPPPAKKKTGRGKQGKRAKTWDPKHDAKRWKRERERSPLIAKLVPNMVLRREYKGVMVEVRVMADGYKYKDKKYPTLYAVVKEVTGTIQCPKMKAKDGSRKEGTRALSNWSAARFFKLAVVLKDRE